MKDTIADGLTSSTKLTVDRDRTIDFMGEKARVYATPMLVRDVEIACRELLLEHLDAGEDSVGTRVDIEHLAATPLGMTVEIHVTVMSVEGRSVGFRVEAHDGLDVVCRGQHQRFVVDVAKTATRLADKVAKAGLA